MMWSVGGVKGKKETGLTIVDTYGVVF